MTLPQKLPVLLAALLLSACAVGPDFHAPKAPAVSGYTHQPLPVTTPASKTLLGTAQTFGGQLANNDEWWKSFHSPRLDHLIDEALAANPSITAARATLEEARQTWAAQAGSTLYPKASLGLGAERQAFNDAFFGQNGTNIFNLYNANVAVSYQFDLFGANKRALESLAAQSDYQQQELRAAQLTLAGNIATAAMTQAALSAQIDATQQIIALQQKNLALAEQRQHMGAIALSDVLSLKAQLEQTQASLPTLQNRLQQTSHLLASLLGKSPAGFTVPDFKLTDFTLPAQLPLVVPSRLVRSRPDIQAAEAMLHAANAQYGVAVANLYPQINLSANVGQESLTPGALFNPAASVWSLAGQLSQPLFNGGLKAGVEAAKANLRAVDANYQQTVLQAFRNVADSLRALDNDAQTLAAQTAADDTAQQSLDLTTQQFHLGSASYLQWLISQQQAQQSRINLIAAQAQRLTDTVALYQAMGGAWVTTSLSFDFGNRTQRLSIYMHLYAEHSL